MSRPLGCRHPRAVRRWPLRGLFPLAIAAVSAQHAAAQEENFTESPARRLSTSVRCRVSLDEMLQDSNYQFVYNKATRWCRVRAENQMAHCCSIIDFPKGTAEGCDPARCLAGCVHQQLADLCSYFGRACAVRRHPFARSGPFAEARPSDGPVLQVLETFCVPRACDNGPDREALMSWYSLRYRAERSIGWLANYDQAVLECDSGVLVILLATIFCIALIVASVPGLFYICVAPRERGRELVSQAEMNSDLADTVEPVDDFLKSNNHLRSLGQEQHTAAIPQGTY